MAPRSDGAPRSRGGHRTGRSEGEHHHRNANTGAGIVRSSGRDAAARNRYGYRAGYGGGRGQRAHNPNPRPRLVERMTIGDERYPKQDTAGHECSGTARPQRGRARETQDRDAGSGSAASRGLQGSSHPLGLAARITTTGHEDEDIEHFPDSTERSSLFCSPQPTRPARPTQPTQPTQLPSIPQVRLPPIPTTFPTGRPVFIPSNTGPVRIVNQPQYIKHPARPVNSYRGKDTVKKMVQNARLRALLSDKPMPRERKKCVLDRPALRLGMGKAT